MKILFVAWRDLANELAGGSEVLIDRLASGIVQRGHDVALMCAHPVEPRNYPVQPNGGKLGQYPRAPFQYMRSFRDRDLVVDVANGMAFFAPVWRRGPSVCFVNHIHTEQWAQWFPAPIAAFGRNMERHVMPRVYKDRLFISVSPSTSQGLVNIGVKPANIRTIINGTDLPSSEGTESPEPLFVSLGRMVPHKRLDIMLRAWEQVRPHTGGRLVLIGDGPERERLEATAPEGVEFVGKISEEAKQDLLSQAWMLVHTASHEGWGLVIMEAAAHGTPAVAFRVAGIQDSVSPGVSGELVDTEEELVQAWIDLAADRARRQELRTGARIRASEFTWESTVDTFLAICEEAIELHTKPDRRKRRAARPLPRVLDAPTADPANVVRLAGPHPGERPELSIVLPAFNEEARLPIAMPRLLDALDGTDTEIIVVDDGSSDNTRQVATDLLAGVAGARVLSLGSHRGKGAAVRTGVQAARGHTIAFMDADLATDLEFLAPLRAALSDHHISIGSRSAPGAITNGWTPSQDAAHRSFNQLARFATGLPYSDFQCGFKAFRAPVAKLLFHLLEEEGFAFDVELLALADRIGYRIAEIPVHWQSVRGSHMRIVVDSALMAVQVGRIGARNRSGRLLASVEALPRTDTVTPSELALELDQQMSSAAPVVPWNDGALVLLPFAEPDECQALAARLQEDLPHAVLTASSIEPGALFDPSAHKLRSALAGS